MDYKKLSAVFPMIGGGVMVVWGLLANDWSKCWIAAVIGGILAGICGVLGHKEDENKSTLRNPLSRLHFPAKSNTITCTFFRGQRTGCDRIAQQGKHPPGNRSFLHGAGSDHPYLPEDGIYG